MVCCGRWGSFVWGRCWACCRCWAWGHCWALGALVVLGLSWDERGWVDVVTYRDVTTNDDFRSTFVVQLPRHCQRRGTCERGMSGGGLTSTRHHRLCPLVGCCGFEEPVLMGMVFGDGG